MGLTQQDGLFYCSESCCGTRYSKYCCPDTTYWYDNTGAVIGLVVGCVFAAGIIIALIVAIVCCFRKRKGSHGQVLVAMGGRPSHITTVEQTMYPDSPPSYTESVSNEQSGQNVTQQSVT